MHCYQEKPIEHTLVCFGAMGGLWSFFQKLGLNLTMHSTPGAARSPRVRLTQDL